MNDISYLLSYLAIALATIIGIVRYAQLSSPMRIIVIILIITTANELCSYIAGSNGKYTIRYTVYHFYDIILSVLVTSYFLHAVRPHADNRKLVVIAALVWSALGVSNFLFLQPLTTLNTNMLMLESFCFITLSLYFIYTTLKSDRVSNILYYDHFWMSICWLVLWSSSLFFWAFVKILYRGRWPYVSAALHTEALINAIVYTGIGVTLLYSHKKPELDKRH